MVELWRGRVTRLLRIPPEPQVPHGEDGGTRVFRAAPGFFRYSLVRWGVTQLAALAGLIVGMILVRFFSASLGRFGIFDVVVWLEIGAWLSFLVQLPFTFVMLWLDYDQRWYIVTGRSLRIREGLVRVREQTMTFANLQNMSIRQGPLQRLLGIADLEVQTAGGGSAGEGSSGDGGSRPLHVGVFRGVDNAAEIRNVIRERVRLHRDAGLGDPDDAQPAAVASEATPSVPATHPVLGAARELLTEVRLLRGRHLQEAEEGPARLSR